MRWLGPRARRRGPERASGPGRGAARAAQRGRRHQASRPRQCERSVKIKLKILKTYFENKNNTILKMKDLAAKIR